MSIPQRRIKHLSSIQIRNLSLNPIRDLASSALLLSSTSNLTRNQFAADDLDVYMTRRRRTSSAASRSSSRVPSLEWREMEKETAELGALEESPNSSAGSSGMERGNSGSSGARSIGMAYDGYDPTVGDAVEPPSHDDSSIQPTSLCSSSTTSTATTTSLPSAYVRRRSTSRASLASANSTHSASTIRPINRTSSTRIASSATSILPSTTLTHTSYTSESLAVKDKQKRVNTIKRRLIDSYITLSLVASSAPSAPSAPSDSVRSTSDKAREATFASTVNSVERKRLSRTRSRSSNSFGTSKGQGKASPAAAIFAALPPFYQSKTYTASMYPSFEIDSTHFLVDEPQTWIGQNERKFVLEIWTTGETSGDETNDGDQWRSLMKVEVNLDELVSLGNDPHSLPPLPPNSLVFNINNEYFTTPATSPSRTSDSGEEEAESGNHSDPGSLSVIKPSTTKRKVAQRTTSLEKDTRTIESQSLDEIVELESLTRLMLENQYSRDTLKSKLDAIYADPADCPCLDRETAELSDRISDFALVHEELKIDCEDVRADIECRKIALKARRGRLKDARDLVEQGLSDLIEVEAGIAIDVVMCESRRSHSTERRTSLVTIFSKIIPINPSLSSDPSLLLFTILDLPLQNSSYPVSASDDVLSSALGYVAFVTEILARYLNIPLHYPINFLGSRSTILDLISVMSAPRAFPLYGKGVEKYRFDYGVFLLNKDIEQLMNSQSLIVLDLRNTLPNLKMLLLSLSYDSSHASFDSPSFVLPSASTTTLDISTVNDVVKLGQTTPKAKSKSLSIRSISPSPTLQGSSGSTSTINGNVYMNGNGKPN